MAALRHSETDPTTPATASAAEDRLAWWEGVQLGVSAMLTEAAHATAPQRLAG